MNDTVLDAARRLAAAGIDTARLDARLLWDYAQKTEEDFEALVARREKREPIAYILGRKEFWSLDFQVGPGVLVPRPDTETLIEETLRLVPDRGAPLRIADLGTGSGAILIAALKEFPNAAGIGFESSPDAFEWANDNAARLIGGRAEIRLADWNSAEGPSTWSSNPPYIRSGEIESLAPKYRTRTPRALMAAGRLALIGPGGTPAGPAETGRPCLLEIGLGQANVGQPVPKLKIEGCARSAGVLAA